MRKIRKPTKQSNKSKSPFINYCITTVSCLIIACAACCFMFFKTDIIVNLDNSNYTSSTYYNSISVETIINNLEQESNQPSINNESPQDENVPGVTEMVATDTLILPNPGELISGKLVNAQREISVPRNSKDAWTMECTVKKYNSISTIISTRIENLKSISSATSIGQEDSLLTFTIDGQLYYAVALVDGFMKEYGAYQVYLNDGSIFNCVAIDAKSLNDRPGSGADNVLNSAYGHGYYIQNSNVVQMSVVEFSDASLSKTSVAHNSAAQYPNNPGLANKYVTKINYIKQLR